MPKNFPVPHAAALILSFAASPLAQAAPPSFLCSRASGWVENTICAHENLSALDMEVASAYARMLRLPDTAKRARVERAQRQWWAARQGCQSAAAPLVCLADAHRARLAALKQDGDYPGDAPVRRRLILQESSIKLAGPGWTRHLSTYAKAIARCRAEARVPVTGVAAAWPEDRGDTIAMWLGTQARHLHCRATKRGDKLLSLREQAYGEALPEVEAHLDFRPTQPDTACEPVPVLDAQGNPFGWLMRTRC